MVSYFVDFNFGKEILQFSLDNERWLHWKQFKDITVQFNLKIWIISVIQSSDRVVTTSSDNETLEKYTGIEY